MNVIFNYLDELFSWIPEPFNSVFMGAVSLLILFTSVDVVARLWSLVGKH